ncbi:hypothetical protein ABZS29_20120 [Kribbella sp. NPDC005582]|uniref:hypothetical protein n=1 Tax=Kribbella sp. NPDC005582 TaxID=3156893 RepID=UPI0033B914AE
MFLAQYLGLLEQSSQVLADAFDQVGAAHADEPDVEHTCKILAGHARDHVRTLRPIIDRYGEQGDPEPDRLAAAEFGGTRSGGVGLLRDLQDLYALASFVDITWTVVEQAGQGLRDQELVELAAEREADTARQLTWLQTRMKQAAPQALIVG